MTTLLAESAATLAGTSETPELAGGAMPPRGRRVEILEPLRGLAALAVAWFHFTNATGLLPEGWLRASGRYGWLGVEVFFVISGFIIPYSLFNAGYRFPRHAGRFILKRIVRLDPPYIAAILLTIALWYLSAAAPGYRGTVPQLEWLTLLLHLGYLNAFFGFPWVIPVLWTLAIEFQFYLLMAIVFPVAASRSWAPRLATLVVFCGVPFFASGEALVFRFLGLFALGIITFQRSIGRLSSRAYLGLLALAASTSYFAIGLQMTLAGVLTALLIAYVELPKFGPLTFLGAMSYSLYLLHVPVGGRAVNLGSRWAGETAWRLAVPFVALAISIVASYLLYRFVERPARKWSASLRYSPG